MTAKVKSWSEFCAKQDYEGTEYMITQLDPQGVPKELKAAQAKLKAAFDEWDAIIQANYVDPAGEDEV